ncbi:MAG TPA: DnaA regulatory inactivator Hda [Burkholderiaceae bacterium]|jgi:DnaA family protein|nr:DnaA regulatory inactivator Hda [Burkholderiaceae bacterium]
MKQIPLGLTPDPAQRFDSFVAGANAAVLEHLRGLSLPAAPVYLWGPPGSGKTHLLRAMVAEREQHGERAAWFAASDATPWQLDEAWSLIVFDDCERYDALQQQAAFSLFVQASVLGLQIAAAGRVPPVDLPVREDLRTRLGWGHVFAVQPLAEDHVRAVLRREADRRGVFLSDEVMGYLLTRFARDLKHLMALLDRLDGFALSQQRAVTVPLLKRMLSEEGGTP